MAGRGGKRRQVLQLGSASKLHRYGYSKEFHSRDKKDKAVVPTLVGDYSDTESEGSSEAQEKLDEDFKDEEVDAALAFTATSTDPVVGLSDGIDGSAMHDKPSDMDDELKNFLSEIEAIPVPVELEGTEQEKLPESDTNSTNVSATVSEVPKPTTKSGYGSHQYSMFVKGESEFVRNAEETKEDKVDKISEELKEEDIPEEPHTDWQMVQDEQSQYYYYWNTVTNEVTWEIPTEYTQYLLLHREYEDKIAKFTPEQLQALKEKIKLAVKNSGITLSGDETSPPNSVQELNSTEDHCSIVTSQAEDDKSHKVSIDSEPAFATQRRPSPAKVLSYPDTDTNSKHHKHKKEKRGHHKKKHKQKHRDSEEDKSTSKIPDISTSTVISESSTAVLVPGKILTSIVPYLSDQDDDEDDGNDNTNQIHSPSFSAAEPGVKEQGPAQVKEYGPKWVKEQGLTQVKEYGPTWVKDQGPTQVKEQGVTEVKEYGPKWDKEQGPSQVKEYGPTLVKEQGLSEVKDHGPAQAVLGPLLVTEQEPTQIKEQVPIEVKDQGPIEVKEQGSIKVKGQGPHWIKEQRPTEVQDQEPSEVQEQGPTEDKEQPQGSILENELIPAGTESSLSADAASSQVLTTHDIPHIVLTSEAAADLISVLLLPPPPPPPPPEEVSTTDELVLTTHSFEGDNLTTNSIDGPRLHTDEPDHQNTLDRSAADSINTGVISEEFSAMAVLSQQPTITENKIETHNNTEQDSSLGLVNSEEAQATNKVKQAIDMFAEYFPTELCTEKELTSTTENNMDMHTDKGASNGAEPADRMMEEGEIDEALEKVSFQPQVKCETSNNIEEDSTVIKRKEKQDRGPLSKGISIIGYAIDEEEVEKDVRDTIVKREKTTSKQKKKDKKDKKKDSKRHRKELKDDLSIDKVEKKIVHDISAENDKAVQSADKKTERKTTHDISTESDKIVHQSAYQKVEKKKSAHDFSEDKTVHFTDKKAKKKSFHDFSGVHEKTDHSADNKAEKKTIYDISAVSDKAIHSEDKKVGKKTVNDFTAANDKAICSVDSKVENKTSICISAMGEKVIPFTSNEGPFETTVNCVEERNDDDDDNGDIDLEDVDDIDRALEVALEKKKAEQLAQMDDKENRYVGENITTAVHGKYDQPQVKTAVILTQPNDSDLKGLTANGVSSQPSEKQISANEAEEKSSEKEGDSHMLAIKDMAELALSKLEFLDISTDNLSRLQVLFIELQTRYTDWTTGGLGTPYFYKQLKIAEDLLEQYELSAVPEGWVCQWDRANNRYYYRNEVTNRIQWEYPEAGNEVKDTQGSTTSINESVTKARDRDADEHRRSRGSGSSRHRKREDKSKSKHDKRGSSHHYRRKRRRTRDQSASSNSSEESQHRYPRKSKKKKRHRSDRSPSVEIVENPEDDTSEVEIVEIPATVNNTPPPLVTSPAACSPAGEVPVTHPETMTPPELTDTVLDGYPIEDTLDVDGVAMEPEENDQEAEVGNADNIIPEEAVIGNPAVISKPPQIIVPPQLIASLNADAQAGEFYNSSQIMGSYYPSYTAVPPFESQQPNAEVPNESNETAAEVEKHAKKKKKEKKALSTGSSIMMKKKHMTSMVQKWQKVKIEAEKEDRAKELRQAAIRKKIEELKNVDKQS